MGRVLHEVSKVAQREVDAFRNSLAVLSSAVLGTSNKRYEEGLYTMFSVTWQEDSPPENVYMSSIGDKMEDEIIRTKVSNYKYGWNNNATQAKMFALLSLKTLLSPEAQEHFKTLKEHPQADTGESFNPIQSASMLY